jgi:hypothetical protein
MKTLVFSKSRVKALVLSGLCIGLCLSVSAQTNRYLPIRLPSYNAISILDHLKTPRGQYTGIPEISVPITTVQSRKLSLPITLNYNAGGVRVGTLASWVGLNWSLDAGGVVIRVPYGATDTYRWNATKFETLVAAEPDLFYFQVAGVSGKFFVVNGASGVECVTMPASNLVIKPIWSGQTNPATIIGFQLMDDAGNQYQVTQVETSQIRINGGTAEALETNAWYLTKIVPGTYGDDITLEYTTYTTGFHFVAHSATSQVAGERSFTNAATGNYVTYPGTPHGNSAAACTNCPTITTPSLDVARVEMKLTQGVRLSRINFANGRVDLLTYGANRDDLDDRALRYIDMYSTYDGETRLISRHELIYSYFSASCSTATSDKRLRLDRVKQWYDGLWNATPNPTKSIDTWFTYDDSQCLPKRDSYAQDMWGFWNGSSPTTLGIGLSTSNRSLGSIATRKIGSLIAINTQAGARTRYTYEGHQGESGTAVGGLRIASVEVQPNGVDGASDNILRQYVYTESNGTSSGVTRPASSSYPMGQETGFKQQLYRVLSTASGCTPPANHRLACGTWLCGTFTRYDLLQESHIEYSRVIENRGYDVQSGTYGVNGRTVAEYITQAHSSGSPQDVVSTTYLGAPPTFRDWRRGMSTKVELFDMKIPSSPSMVSTSTSSYNLYTTGSGFAYKSAVGTSTKSYTVASQTYNLSGTYSHEGGWYNTSQTHSQAYSQDVPPVAFPPTTTYFTYNNTALLLREQESTGDGTERRGSYYRYAREITLPVNGTDDAAVAALRSLQTTGRGNTPIEVLSFRRASPGATQQITGGSISVFRNHQVQEIGGPLRTVALPHRSFSARMTQPQALTAAPSVANVSGTNQLNVSALYGYSLTADDHRTEGIQLAYDSYGQPTKSKNRLGRLSDVLYGYSGAEAIATVTNGSFARPASTDAATASFCDAENTLDGTVNSDGWALYGNAGRVTTQAHTGKYSLYAPVNQGTASNGWNGVAFRHMYAEDQTATYVLSAWVKSDGPGSLNLRAAISSSQALPGSCAANSYKEESVAIPNTNGTWQLFTTRLDLNRVRAENNAANCLNGQPIYLLAFASITNGTIHRIYLDDIRLHKLDATMQSATYLPSVGATSTSDALSNCTYTEFDDLGRVVLVRDKDGKIVKQLIYQIK